MSKLIKLYTNDLYISLYINCTWILKELGGGKRKWLQFWHEQQVSTEIQNQNFPSESLDRLGGRGSLRHSQPGSSFGKKPSTWGLTFCFLGDSPNVSVSFLHKSSHIPFSYNRKNISHQQIHLSHLNITSSTQHRHLFDLTAVWPALSYLIRPHGPCRVLVTLDHSEFSKTIRKSFTSPIMSSLAIKRKLCLRNDYLLLPPGISLCFFSLVF